MDERVAILDGVRTPFCKAGGALAAAHADDLGAYVSREVIDRIGLAVNAVDEVIFGNVAQPIHAANVARVIALKAGLPESVIALTVHRNCASGMQAITTAATQILSRRADLIVAGGTESMSQIPLLVSASMTRVLIQLMKARTLGQRLKTIAAIRPSYFKPVIALQLGLTDPVCELNMGQTAEVLAREFGVTREEQDSYALQSHQKAVSAQREGRLDDEISAAITPPRYDRVVCSDDGPRRNQSMESLGKLTPYFDRHAGTVTVGNACPVTDGAAAVVLASERKVRELGVQPLGYLSGWSYAALDGKRMGLGPAFATAKLFESTGLAISDFDVVELNEAFAAQVIANERAFASSKFGRKELNRSTSLGEIDRDKLNVNGGAIALGHPVGASGTRLVVTMLKQLRRNGGGRGLATLCVGGGQGAALALEAA